MSLKAYQKVSKSAEDPRLMEYRLFGEVTRALMEAQKADKLEYGLIAEALGWNRRMWSVLGIECASEDNGLPAELRASIISLSIWVDKYTSKVMLGDGDIADLIDINRIIMAGLNTNDSDRADRNVTARDSAHGGEAAQVALLKTRLGDFCRAGSIVPTMMGLDAGALAGIFLFAI